MPLFQRPTAIRRKTLRMILGASKDAYPNEFGAILRAEKGVITELLLIPGTIGGDRHAIFRLYNKPTDFRVVGTVHSHPSGVFHPSGQDPHPFSQVAGGNSPTPSRPTSPPRTESIISEQSLGVHGGDACSLIHRRSQCRAMSNSPWVIKPRGLTRRCRRRCRRATSRDGFTGG